MSSYASRTFRFIKNKWFIASAVIIVLGVWYITAHKNTAPTFESTPVAVGTVVERVSVTGTILPVSRADLAFKKSGVISKISVTVGTPVKRGDVIASLDNVGDEAALQSAQAQLADLKRGLRPEEYALDQANVSAASTSLANAQKDALNAVHDGYVKAQSAIVNYSDTFFNNAQSPNPTLNVVAQSIVTQRALVNERVQVSTILNQWKSDSDTATVANSSALIARAQGYVTSIKSFLSDLSTVVNGLTLENSGISQSMIDADVSTMNTALSTLTGAITSVSSADTELRNAQATFTTAQNQFAVQQAGSSADAIAAQAAKVAQAQAVVADDSIVSPIDGIVTRADPSVGEFVAAGASGFAVQSNGAYKIEAYVPEADISKIVVGDYASSTLDAYGSGVDFPAQVTLIDPAETVIQGVPTYKVTLQFISPDARIRSGMTANLDILTHEVEGVLQIPYRAVTITSTSTTVRVVSTDGKTYVAVPIVTGLKGSDGTIQVISGLKKGDSVVTYVK